MHWRVRRLTIVRLNRSPDDDDSNRIEDEVDDFDNVDEGAEPQGADAATLLDVAVHVAWHPWALTPAYHHGDDGDDHVDYTR